MRILPLLLLLTITLMCVVRADSEEYDRSGPDDALCATYSGTNSTCSSCIIQGCSYCDTTGTGMGGLCVSHHTATTTCRVNNTLVSSFASLTQCRTTQHDLYESIAAFIPISTGIVGVVLFLLIAWFVRPAYAPAPTQQEAVLVVSDSDQPLLGSTSRWILIKQQLTRDNMRRHCRRSGCCYKLFIVIVLIVVFALSIVAVAGGMWSIQVDGNLDDWEDDHWKSATSAIAYDGYGIHTITRDINNHKKLIFRWSPYTCNAVLDDNFIRCSLHRIISHVTHSVAIMGLTCISIVMFLMLWSIIRCRSLNSVSVKFMSLTAISHLIAVIVYVGGSFLLQTRVYHNSEYVKNTTSSPSSYHLFLGLNWNVSVAAFILNVVLLIPLTRAHIGAIPKPEKKGCCCKKQQQQQQEQQQTPPNMGVTVALPMEQPAATNPGYVHNPYAAGATSYMSPSYQYGTVQSTPAQSTTSSYQYGTAPAAQPLRGFTNEI